jgi:hypothetical protein
MRVEPVNFCVIQHILRFISGYSIKTKMRAPRGIRERVLVPFETRLFVAWRRAIADRNHVSCYHLDP